MTAACMDSIRRRRSKRRDGLAKRSCLGRSWHVRTVRRSIVAVVDEIEKAQAESRQAKQAVRAARDAADAESRTAAALERTVDIHTAQERRAAEEFEAEKESPWDLLPISGDDYCVLVNRTGRPKYQVHIGGSAVPPPGVRVHEIPARGRVEVSVLRIWAPDQVVKVSWHATRTDPKRRGRVPTTCQPNWLIGGGQPGHRPARRHGPGARVSMCQHPRPRRQSDTGAERMICEPQARRPD